MTDSTALGGLGVEVPPLSTLASGTVWGNSKTPYVHPLHSVSPADRHHHRAHLRTVLLLNLITPP